MLQELELVMLLTGHVNCACGTLLCREPLGTPACAGVLHMFLHHMFLHTNAPLPMKSCLLALRVVKCPSLLEPRLLGASYEPGQAWLVSFLS